MRQVFRFLQSLRFLHVLDFKFHPRGLFFLFSQRMMEAAVSTAAKVSVADLDLEQVVSLLEQWKLDKYMREQ